IGPQAADLGLDYGRGAVRGRMRRARAVVESAVAFGPPAADPLVGGGTGYAHLGRDMRDRAARQDAFDQDPPAVNGQPGITVGHEDLRAV
ncbi:hypothetical protein ACS04_24525, partial [Streptomyces roseus]